MSNFKHWIESDRVSQRATGQFPASRYSHAHNPDGISWRKTTVSLDIIGLWMHLYLWCWGFPYGLASISKKCRSAELLLHSNSPHHLRWRQNLRRWKCFHRIGVILLGKYGCYVGILSLERDGSTGPTQHLLRLIRIKVQLFGENLEQEKNRGKEREVVAA